VVFDYGYAVREKRVPFSLGPTLIFSEWLVLERYGVRCVKPWRAVLSQVSFPVGGDSDDADQSFRSDADQIGAKRRRALSV